MAGQIIDSAMYPEFTYLNWYFYPTECVFTHQNWLTSNFGKYWENKKGLSRNSQKILRTKKIVLDSMNTTDDAVKQPMLRDLTTWSNTTHCSI